LRTQFCEKTLKTLLMTIQKKPQICAILKLVSFL
jgi:hypothetical protein